MQFIPDQQQGKSVDLEEIEEASDEITAKKIYETAIHTLQRPHLWKKVAGDLSASFTIDGKGDEVLKPSDHLRITIPGPGLKEGDGDDWVKVMAAEKDVDENADESFGVLVQVSPNPHTENPAIAHFFAEGASSTFMISRKGNIVKAEYKGRNELPNTDRLDLTDKLRNVVVAGGAMVGISELQWKALLRGLLRESS